MKTAKKIILFLSLSLIIILGFGVFSIFYFYTHPQTIKPAIEKVLSRTTGTLITINRLSWSVRPIRITASGIRLKSVKKIDIYQGAISSLAIDISFDGPFGKKTMIVENLQVQDFSVRLSEGWSAPGISVDKGESSFLSGVVRRLTDLFIFSDIRFRELQITNGDLVAFMGDSNVSLEMIQCSLNKDHLIEVSCKARVDREKDEISLLIPRIHLATDNALSILKPEIRGGLTIEEASFRGKKLNIGDIHGTAGIDYDLSKKRLSFESVKLYMENVAYRDVSEDRSVSYDLFSQGLEIKTALISNHDEGKLTFEPISININNGMLRLSSAAGTKESLFGFQEVDIRDITLDASIIYDHELRKLVFEPASLRSKNIFLKPEAGESRYPLSLSVSTKGVFYLQNRLISASEFDFNLEHMISSSGQLEAGFKTQPQVTIRLHECRVLPEKILLFLPKEMREKIDPLQLSGPVNILGSVSVGREGKKGRVEGEIEARFKKNPLVFKGEKFDFECHISGDMSAKGIFPDVNISADISAEQASLFGKGYLFEPFGASLKLSGRYPVFNVKDLRTHIPSAVFTLGERDLRIDNIRLHAPEGRLDRTGKTISFPEIRLESSLMKSLVLGFESDGENSAFQLRGKANDILKTARDLDILPAGWRFSGIDEIDAAISLKGKSQLSLAARLNLSEFKFENSDSSRVGEGLSVNISTESEIDLKTYFSNIDLDVEASKGEILYGRFYFDLGVNPLAISLKGSYDPIKKGLNVPDFALKLKDLLAVNGKGTIPYESKDPGPRISINIPDTPVKPVFHYFVYEPFKMEHPVLNDIDIQGDISAEISLEGNGGKWKLIGDCFLDNGEILLERKGIYFRGIDLDLPIWYQSIADDLKQTEKKGMISIRSASARLFPEQSISVSLEASPNSMSINSPTQLKVPGGEVMIGSIKITEIYTPSPVLNTNISFQDIEIQALLQEFLPHLEKGLVSGSLDSVKLDRNRFTTTGQIRATPFSGEILITNLGASGIFTSSPLLKMDVQLNNLDLSEITTDTSFGRIQGILRGHLQELEIAHGQPQKFNLLLETVQTKGSTQRISVKAVDNIARIGGGQSPFVGLAGAFASFFKELPYNMIGIRAYLENDVFRINGTIKENGMEYIIKRSGFSGVDVLNQNPDNRISFKDMVKRIERVTGSEP